MDAVMRYQVADYLNTAKSGTESFALMGVGFNTLDESPTRRRIPKHTSIRKPRPLRLKAISLRLRLIRI